MPNYRETAGRKQNGHVEAFLVHRLQLRHAVEVTLAGFAVFLLEKILTIFRQRWILRVARNRHDLALDLDAEVTEGAIEAFGRALEIFLVDVALPQVGRLENVHIGIHRFETILGHWVSP